MRGPTESSWNCIWLSSTLWIIITFIMVLNWALIKVSPLARYRTNTISSFYFCLSLVKKTLRYSWSYWMDRQLSPVSSTSMGQKNPTQIWISWSISPKKTRCLFIRLRKSLSSLFWCLSYCTRRLTAIRLFLNPGTTMSENFLVGCMLVV